jgi:hypothetical protein
MRRLVSKGLLKVSLDPLDDRKRLVKKADLEALKTPRPQHKSSGKARGKRHNSNIKRGSVPNE